jgi:acetyl-CoA carboxylase carboxyl transferase subunit alpha
MVQIANPLDFERELVVLDNELDELKGKIEAGELSLRDQYDRLERRVKKLRQDTYSKLTSYQRVQLSRHFDRPFTLDYIKHIFTDFVELHGDRCYRDDAAIVGGTARLNDTPIMIVGHQRGRSTLERVERNFGMPQPEGYRKAKRLFLLAEKFGLPVICFIDTQGAYPGVEAEERGQAEAIATNLLVLSELNVPVISVVIGEGGSGGALALGISDRILILENGCYSVISPEACASILWKNLSEDEMTEKRAYAADLLHLTAENLDKLGVIDEIVKEPFGGAHWNHQESAVNLMRALQKHLSELMPLSSSDLLEQRYNKFRQIGVFTE